MEKSSSYGIAATNNASGNTANQPASLHKQFVRNQKAIKQAKGMIYA